MDEEARQAIGTLERTLEAVMREIPPMKARAMAHEAVHNALLYCWGEPRSTVTAYLRQTAERVESTGLPTAAPEAALDAIREVFAHAFLAIEGGPPDTQ